MDPYRQLAAVLGPDGIRCYFQTAGQMVVSKQAGLVLPDRGNSFWVTRPGIWWHLFTWASVGYRVPEVADIARLCRVCTNWGTSAMARVPAQIVQEFELTELSDDEIEAVFAEIERCVQPGTTDGDGSH